jgi:hypothetical protein
MSVFLEVLRELLVINESESLWWEAGRWEPKGEGSEEEAMLDGRQWCHWAKLMMEMARRHSHHLESSIMRTPPQLTSSPIANHHELGLHLLNQPSPYLYSKMSNLHHIIFNHHIAPFAHKLSQILRSLFLSTFLYTFYFSPSFSNQASTIFIHNNYVWVAPTSYKSQQPLPCLSVSGGQPGPAHPAQHW